MKISVIKVGGNVINDEAALASFLEQFSQLEGAKVLVHGGGKLATAMAQRLGIEPKMVDGRRVTDAETLEVVTMVYGGLVNKRIIAQLQAKGCNAIGLTGADANIIEADKRTGWEIDYGFVGDVRKANAAPIINFAEQNITPVIAPLTHDGKGQLFNTNADTMAQAVAVALGKAGHEVSLRYCFEKAGVLLDVNDDNSLVPVLNPTKFAQFKEEGIVADGMLPKLKNAFDAIDASVAEVWLGKVEGVLANTPIGTKIIGA
ncbi:acetylglutamate kinase [Flammeovirga kamogawensis]|uniref:Acetylglutamate kinase n=1 Tax=Flammeovirga kamogawensis TaxID=373891 RepID=A0ABX8H0E1_9BACT|nr:acetylglutamate kinase [Flammeovirga kamogawensis]MBB6459233.1 acetylglutamate kinase [Flammeovirga kamogawensis]QWG08797.1 acetylglutamate kinase [Flammeovirga kamogawensis]TRX67087.1 acetylglutamate kinase [Flammeovirga kamogawensis]